MTDYMTTTTELPPYFFFPWFLMEMELTFTAKLTYTIAAPKRWQAQTPSRTSRKNA